MASDNFKKIDKGINFRPQASEPAVIPGLDGRVYFDDALKKLRVQRFDAWSNIGGGGLGVNFITNPDAEAGLDGYVLYADAPGVAPVDGTGGSPAGVTFSKTTNPAEVLYELGSFKISKDAVNRQGTGVSYNFQIPKGYRERTQTIKFIYDTTANFSYGAGTFASPSDISVWIYDVDVGTLVPVSTNYLDGSGAFLASFQPVNSSSVNYRIIFHISGTNALAWDLIFDQLIVGPNEATPGQVVLQESITLTGFTSKNVNDNIRFSTVKENSGQFLITTQVVSGESRIIALRKCKVAFTAAAQHASSVSSYSIRVFDSSDNFIYGSETINLAVNSLTGQASCALELNPGDYAVVQVGTAAAINNNFFTNFSALAFETSNVTLSSIQGNRQIYAILRKPSTQSGASIKLDLTVQEDNTNSFNTSTDDYVIPETGLYQFNYVQEVTGVGAGQAAAFHIFVNGSSVLFSRAYGTSASTASAPLSASLYLSAGDLVSFRVIGTVAVNALGSPGNIISIFKISNPQTIASEGPQTMLFKYEVPSGTPATTLTNGSYGTIPINKIEGSFQFGSLSANQITLQPGKYIIDFQVSIQIPLAGVDTFAKGRLFDGTTTIATTNAIQADNYEVAQFLNGSTALTLATPRTFSFQTRANKNGLSHGFAVNFGDPETYAIVKVTKLG